MRKDDVYDVARQRSEGGEILLLLFPFSLSGDFLKKLNVTAHISRSG